MSKVPEYSWDQAHSKGSIRVMEDLTPQYLKDEHNARVLAQFWKNVEMANDPEYQATLKMPLDLTDQFVKEIDEELSREIGYLVFRVNTSRRIH